jgi:phosphonate transport system substrate-binding protein
MSGWIALLGLWALAGSSAPTLEIGLVPEENIFRLVERYEPIGSWIHRRSGIQVRFVPLASYEEAEERLARSELDGAFLGSFTAAVGVRQLGLEPLARPVFPGGISTYRGYLFVRRDSSIREVADMKGKVLALVNPATTAGYLFPVAFLRARGVASLEGYFQESYFAGTHDAAVRAVLAGKADVGCAKSTIYDRLARANPRLGVELIILARSAAVPSNVLALRSDVPSYVRKGVSDALLTMDRSEEGRRQLAAFGAVRFIPTRAEEYEPVYEMAARAGVPIPPRQGRR